MRAQEQAKKKEEKAQQKVSKEKKKDDAEDKSVCQGCGEHYDEDDKESIHGRMNWLR